MVAQAIMECAMAEAALERLMTLAAQQDVSSSNGYTLELATRCARDSVREIALMIRGDLRREGGHTWHA